MLVSRATLLDFLNRLDEEFGRPGRLYLVGETSQVFEGWKDWTAHAECTAAVAEADRLAFDAALQHAQEEVGIQVIEEHPGDLIPLPDGYEARARPIVTAGRHLALYHFDPYSVAFRFIARGDEPDYHLVLQYLHHGWVTIETMETLLAALLPRFSLQTIQQDPAEFRRKYKGLLQMWKALRPGVVHRPF